MAGQTEHGRILTTAAKEALLPLGFKRKGVSRVYLSDEGLWSCVVEFQSSGFSKGSYLNVAVHWLWTTYDHISFDYGGRIGGFVAFENAEQFAEGSRKLASSAASAVQDLRRTFASTHDIARVLVEAEQDKVRQGSGGCWGAFNAAVASGLNGETATAQALFMSVAQGDASQQWVRERQTDALRLAEITKDPSLFRETIMARVAASRARLKMTGEIAAPS